MKLLLPARLPVNHAVGPRRAHAPMRHRRFTCPLTWFNDLLNPIKLTTLVLLVANPFPCPSSHLPLLNLRSHAFRHFGIRVGYLGLLNQLKGGGGGFSTHASLIWRCPPHLGDNWRPVHHTPFLGEATHGGCKAPPKKQSPPKPYIGPYSTFTYNVHFISDQPY